MKLFLMRHAEAEPLGKNNDFLRILTKEGLQEAEEAAKFLQGFKIDKILLSSSIRTIQTFEIIQEKINCLKYEILLELYASDTEKILSIISEQEQIDKNILVISHNPGIFQAALRLIDSNSPKFKLLLAQGMPTAKIISLDFPTLTNWQNLSIF